MNFNLKGRNTMKKFIVSRDRVCRSRHQLEGRFRLAQGQICRLVARPIWRSSRQLKDVSC
ncbi:hypothetical protein ZEAMMB73_Zm00001d040793 [Zea mays]|uniref:Uncharacterized protein n=1 Tax=Zea mays TaxID=4577 RepID=A0A1D6MSZ9_MAIZE|nr:hypothetical protein ZEAMMB73_Zm00001d040793 [Zea mays]